MEWILITLNDDGAGIGPDFNLGNVFGDIYPGGFGRGLGMDQRRDGYCQDCDEGIIKFHKILTVRYTNRRVIWIMRNKPLDMQIEAKLEELSYEELQRVSKEVSRALELKQKQKQEETIRQIRELAASADLDVEIRVKPKAMTKPPSRRGTKLPPKYRHPTDASLTWTGRGQMPRWLRDLVDQGHDREEFRIPD